MPDIKSISEAVQSIRQELGLYGGTTQREPDLESNLTTSGFWVICRIIDYTGGMHVYRVDGVGFRDRYATDVTTSLSILGTRSYAVHQVGSYALVWFSSHHARIGHIVGAISMLDSPLLPLMGTVLTQGTPAGYGQDACHNTWMKAQMAAVEDESRASSAAILQHNQGRPYDTLAGDQGWINEMGVGIGLYKLLASMQAGSAEVAVFYQDNAVRIAGDTIDTETITTENRAFCDQGEGSEISYMTPFSWEGLGRRQPRQEAFDFKDVLVNVEKKDDNRQRYQPQDWEMVGIWRWLKLQGYLGDLLNLYTSCPSKEFMGGKGPVTKTMDREYIGLSNLHIGQDGFVAVRTAKGLLLQKTHTIPLPAEHRDPCDPQGDSDGACDWGTKEYSQDKVDYQWNTSEPRARMASMPDYLAFRQGQADVQHLLDHAKDWKVPSDTDHALFTGPPGRLQPLGETFAAELPASIAVPVDYSRNVTYYRGISWILMDDDGSISAGDVNGSTWNMSGGNFEVSCRGDFIVRAGRRIVMMAPHDLVMRAGHNAEMTASDGNVRIKAEKNMQLLSGNGGTGGTLIENRATGEVHNYQQGDLTASSGITLKSTKASIVEYGHNIYVRSMADDGRIVIDANAGRSPVTVIGSDVTTIANNTITGIVGIETGTLTIPTAVSMTRHDRTHYAMAVAGCNLSLDGNGASLLGGPGVNPHMLVSGLVKAGQGVLSPSTSNTEWAITDNQEDINIINLFVQQARDAMLKRSIPELQDFTYRDADKSFGNLKFVNATSCSFNTTTQYRAGSVKFYELPWQQQYRQGGKPWVEKPVYFQGETNTMPWPGREGWELTDQFGVAADGLGNVDIITGMQVPQPRQNTAGKAPIMKKCNASYVVDPLDKET